MKDAPGKHGSAMPEKAAKKIQRRNGRRASKGELEAQGKEAGLGVAQLAHFNKLSIWDLMEARAFSVRERGNLNTLSAVSGTDLAKKISNHTAVIRYITNLLKKKR